MVCLRSHLKGIVVWHGQGVYQVSGVGSLAMERIWAFVAILEQLTHISLELLDLWTLGQ